MSNYGRPATFSLSATSALFLLIALGTSAQAQTVGNFEVTVDAFQNCITLYEIEQHNFTTTRHPIPTGYYEFTVDTNSYYCGGSCQVKKVALYVTTDDDPYGWFYTVSEGTPTYVHVTGVGAFPNEVRAFFIDIGCGDNFGTATVHFRKIQ